jgi:hypothetical protein
VAGRLLGGGIDEVGECRAERTQGTLDGCAACLVHVEVPAYLEHDRSDAQIRAVVGEWHICSGALRLQRQRRWYWWVRHQRRRLAAPVATDRGTGVERMDGAEGIIVVLPDGHGEKAAVIGDWQALTLLLLADR